MSKQHPIHRTVNVPAMLFDYELQHILSNTRKRIVRVSNLGDMFRIVWKWSHDDRRMGGRVSA
jgi:hypothetical protein